MKLKTYMKSLANHPGIGYAAFLTCAGAIAGRNSPRGMLAGALIMSIFWIPVLITAAQYPYGEDE